MIVWPLLLLLHSKSLLAVKGVEVLWLFNYKHILDRLAAIAGDHRRPGTCPAAEQSMGSLCLRVLTDVMKKIEIDDGMGRTRGTHNNSCDQSNLI